MKIAVILGRFIKVDRGMVMKELLYYVRILIEILIDEELSETIIFENEWGFIKYYAVYYKWKSIRCGKCKMFGYAEDDCKKWSGFYSVERKISFC